jgi:uncharacterized caspase-like protein
MGRVVVLALAFLGLLLLQANAGTERRVALVIGNGTYQEAGTLANPVNDATDVAARLRDLGFEVIEGNDLGKRDLERKIGEFSDALEGAGAGLFYYAGHGLQVDGRNFIVPVDAKLDVPAKLRLETVQIDDILDIMEQQTKTSLVFLDACRNNPFVKSLKRLATNRSAAPLAGLAQFDSTRGSFIAFSTAPGSVALDGAGRNSPFAAALIKHMGDPGQSINDLMIAVRRDVVAETHDAQRPWEQGSLLDRFEFVPGETVAAAAPAAEAKPAAPPPANAPAGSDTQVAALERSVGDTKAIENFLRTDYLQPDTSAMREAVRRVYGDRAKLFGTELDIDAITRIKTDWFAQFSSWSLVLEPGSLEITPRGELRADVSFAMSYDYQPRDKSAAHVTGRTRVLLELVMTEAGWRVASETAEALK